MVAKVGTEIVKAIGKGAANAFKNLSIVFFLARNFNNWDIIVFAAIYFTPITGEVLTPPISNDSPWG